MIFDLYITMHIVREDKSPICILSIDKTTSRGCYKTIGELSRIDICTPYYMGSYTEGIMPWKDWPSFAEKSGALKILHIEKDVTRDFDIINFISTKYPEYMI